MPGPAFLQGETVELRTPEMEDVDFIQEAINDPRVWSSLKVAEPITRTEEEKWVETAGEEGVKLLTCVDGDPVGSISLKPPDEYWGRAELAYFVAPEHWGNGYATEAVELVTEYAFDERRLHKVYATTYATNEGSRRVLEKAGFREEGVHREEAFVGGEYVDLVHYGLLADEHDD